MLSPLRHLQLAAGTGQLVAGREFPGLHEPAPADDPERVLIGRLQGLHATGLVPDDHPARGR